MCQSARRASRVHVLVSSDDEDPLLRESQALVRAVRNHPVIPVVRPSQSVISNTGTSLADADGRQTCAGAVGAACLRNRKIRLVALGINAGPNVSQRAVHSGTIGGLLTAMSLGRVAMAFSADDTYSPGSVDGHMAFGTCEMVASACVGSLLPMLEDVAGTAGDQREHPRGRASRNHWSRGCLGGSWWVGAGRATGGPYYHPRDDADGSARDGLPYGARRCSGGFQWVMLPAYRNWWTNSPDGCGPSGVRDVISYCAELTNGRHRPLCSQR